MATVVRAHLWIGGKVQGVYFRAATREAAQRQGVAGWVRNLPDGRVEAVFEGPPAAVERLVGWCRQGPPAAVVEGVRVEYEPPEGLAHFEVLRS
ncbi:acylphosphatase [Gloeobacter morelensis]|uniref:Acylphosphatase n=1 Tax=Gloeobacter morelensis MG652769 TaxID=2781736 RepID=A0ABY3PRF0_9CYAN|nr:acylphosphatase [Gloeobacter morelensis]UFP96305.1 acylphosphatase [Gloeobacter morelensis MG652769]